MPDPIHPSKMGKDTMADKNDVIIPGEKIGTVEEIIPGRGTFEEDGVIYAKGLGELSLDPEEMKASVNAFKSPARIKKRDLIILVVTDIRNAMVVARAVHIVGKDRQIAGETMASLHVSKVSREYVSDIKRMFRVGDYIRARVIQSSPSIQITTDERDLGVLRALCMNCRTSMFRKGNSLTCPECGRIESRKMAADFGTPDLSKL